MTIVREVERYDDRVRVNFYGSDTLFPLPPDERIGISSMEDLQKIGTEYPSNGNFYLTKDIDAEGYENYDPVSLINGKFDGQGHKISNLFVSRTSYSGTNYYMGPFKDLNYSYVKNLTIENLDMTCLIVGGLTATLNGSRLVNCHTRGGYLKGGLFGGGLFALGSLNNIVGCTVDGALIEAAAVAGLGLLTETAYIIDCHVTDSTMIGNTAIAGFLGQLDKGGKVLSCSAQAYLAYEGPYEDNFQIGGGFALLSTTPVEIKNCYADCTWGYIPPDYGIKGSFMASIDGGTYIEDCYAVSYDATFGLIGEVLDGTVVTSYWDTDVSDQTSSAAGIGKTTLEMQTCSTYSDWDTSTAWSCSEGAYPTLRPVTGYIEYFDIDDIEIGTIEDFQKIGIEDTHPNYRRYILTADLDLTGVDWTPVDLYNGQFNGNDHTISNLSLDLPTTDEVGLFAQINSVSGLTIIDSYVRGRSQVGLITGGVGAANLSLTDCTALDSTVTAGGMAGTLSGGESSSQVNYCRSNSTLVYEDLGVSPEYFGGLVGNISFAQFSVFEGQFQNFSGVITIGGIAGTASTVRKCSAVCDIVGSNEVGGIVGRGIRVEDCYHKGYLSGGGGIMGINGLYTSPKIYRCYNYGSLGVGSRPILANMQPYSFFSVMENCYYNRESFPSGLTWGTAIDGTDMVCPSTSFVGFDFDTIWDCNTGLTPTHQADIMIAPEDEESNFLFYSINDGQQFRDFGLPYGNDWQFENVYIAFAEPLVNDEEVWLAMYVNGGKIIKIQDISTQEAFIQNQIPLQAGDKVVPVVTGENRSEYVGPYYEGYATYRKI